MMALLLWLKTLDPIERGVCEGNWVTMDSAKDSKCGFGCDWKKLL